LDLFLFGDFLRIQGTHQIHHIEKYTTIKGRNIFWNWNFVKLQGDHSNHFILNVPASKFPAAVSITQQRGPGDPP